MLGVRVAKSLYARWRTLGPAARERLAPLAEDAKRAALESRGARDSEAARTDLRSASQTLAAAIVEDAEADPELDDVEVHRLRDDLRRELERLAEADIKVSRNVTPRRPE